MGRRDQGASRPLFANVELRAAHERRFSCLLGVLGVFVVLTLGLVMLLMTVFTREQQEAINTPEYAVAHLHGENVRGTVHFLVAGSNIRVLANVSGLPPHSDHGFHIFEYADDEEEEGSPQFLFGNIFSVSQNISHACPGGTANRRIGDLGNIHTDENGFGSYQRTDDLIKLKGSHSVVGRVVVLHSFADDCVTQPHGGSGEALAHGLIVVANPASKPITQIQTQQPQPQSEPQPQQQPQPQKSHPQKQTHQQQQQQQQQLQPFDNDSDSLLFPNTQTTQNTHHAATPKSAKHVHSMTPLPSPSSFPSHSPSPSSSSSSLPSTTPSASRAPSPSSSTSATPPPPPAAAAAVVQEDTPQAKARDEDPFGLLYNSEGATQQQQAASVAEPTWGQEGNAAGPQQFENNPVWGGENYQAKPPSLFVDPSGPTLHNENANENSNVTPFDIAPKQDAPMFPPAAEAAPEKLSFVDPMAQLFNTPWANSVPAQPQMGAQDPSTNNAGMSGFFDKMFGNKQLQLSHEPLPVLSSNTESSKHANKRRHHKKQKHHSNDGAFDALEEQNNLHVEAASSSNDSKATGDLESGELPGDEDFEVGALAQSSNAVVDKQVEQQAQQQQQEAQPDAQQTNAKKQQDQQPPALAAVQPNIPEAAAQEQPVTENNNQSDNTASGATTLAPLSTNTVPEQQQQQTETAVDNNNSNNDNVAQTEEHPHHKHHRHHHHDEQDSNNNKNNSDNQGDNNRVDGPFSPHPVTEEPQAVENSA